MTYLSFDSADRFRDRQMFVSTGTRMTLLVRRLMANSQDVETEFLDGAYSFFNGSSKCVSPLYTIYFGINDDFPWTFMNRQEKLKTNNRIFIRLRLLTGVVLLKIFLLLNCFYRVKFNSEMRSSIRPASFFCG